MANLTTFKVDDNGAVPFSEPVYFRKRVRIDASQQTIAASDTVELMEFGADQLLLGAAVKVITAEGGTATADIGFTGGDVDEVIDGVNLNATAGTVVKSGDAGTPEAIVAAGGHYFSAVDSLDLLANNELDTAVFDVTAYAINLAGAGISEL